MVWTMAWVKLLVAHWSMHTAGVWRTRRPGSVEYVGLAASSTKHPTTSICCAVAVFDNPASVAVTWIIIKHEK
jgi:hypothetical protein